MEKPWNFSAVCDRQGSQQHSSAVEREPHKGGDEAGGGPGLKVESSKLSSISKTTTEHKKTLTKMEKSKEVAREIMDRAGLQQDLLFGGKCESTIGSGGATVIAGRRRRRKRKRKATTTTTTTSVANKKATTAVKANPPVTIKATNAEADFKAVGAVKSFGSCCIDRAMHLL